MATGEEADFYEALALFRPEEREIQAAARAFVEREVLPDIARHWEEGTFPRHLVPKLGEMGFLGPTLPEAYGGSESSPAAYGLILQELERGDSGLRSFASVQGSLVMHAIYRYGSEEQRRYYLPKLASGTYVGCFGLTEPDAGSDPAGMRTRARRGAGGWVLSGRKRWITNGSIADVAVVWAKDESDVVRGFLVDRGTPGFSTPEIKRKASMRASVTSDLVLDEVVVPEEQRLPSAEGLAAPLSCLTEARFGIAFGAVGAAMDCYAEVRSYLATREAFGRSLLATQLVQERLVDMVSRIARAELVAWRLAQLKEAGTLTYPQVSLAKRDNVRSALEVARMARELLGANGISLEFRSIRHMLNLETVDTYEGTYEVHTLVVGRALTGVGAFVASGR